MPYILPNLREDLDPAIADLANSIITQQASTGKSPAGSLNYAITKLLCTVYPDVTYANINEVIGCLECCKLEMYRAVAAPYEDQKAYENGTVK